MTDLIPGTVDALLARAQAVVDALSDEETNHGGLTSRDTLVKAGELRLELSVWKGAHNVRPPTTAPSRVARGAREAESAGQNSGLPHPQSPGQPSVSTSESSSRKSPSEGVADG